MKVEGSETIGLIIGGAAFLAVGLATWSTYGLAAGLVALIGGTALVGGLLAAIK